MGRPDRVLTTRDLAPSPLYVIATGVTDGGLLRGVRYFGSGARTHSIVMDLAGNTVRFIDTVHLLKSHHHPRDPALTGPGPREEDRT